MNIRTILLRSAAALFVAASISSYAQDELTHPKDATNSKAQERLPGDQAKVTATTSPAGAASNSMATTATTTTATGQPNEAEMMKQMMELSKLGENHKLLAGMVGTWTYNVKMWMAPGAPPSTSTGTATRKAIMEGRYVTGEYNGKMQMPGADGKMMNMEFKGMSLDGYDNVKKKFLSVWVDSMGTGILLAEGTHDPATRTFTYTGEYEPMPGMKTKIREVIKVVDADHHSMEYYEDRGTGEVKSMEIAYARKK